MQMRTGSGPFIGLVGEGPDHLVERRRVPRCGASGSALAHFAGESTDHAIAGVELVDSSASGLGLLSPARVEIGTTARIYLGGVSLPGRVGRVMRCEPVGCEDGRTRYRVGLDTGIAQAA